MSDRSRLAHSSTDRTCWHKGKARADDLSESDDLDASSASSPSKGKGRQTDPVAHSSPVLTLPDMGDNFELHVKSQFSHLDSDGPSSSAKEQYGYHPRSAHCNDLVLCRSTNKRSYKDTSISPLSSPSSMTLEHEALIPETSQRREDCSRIRSVAMTREQVRASPSVYCKKRRANTASTGSLDPNAPSSSRRALLSALNDLPDSHTTTQRRAQRSIDSELSSQPGSFRQRSSLLANSSTSDLGFHPYHLPYDSTPVSSRRAQSPPDSVDSLFELQRRQLDRQARQESDRRAMRRHLDEVAADERDAEPLRSASLSSRNRSSRNSRFEARPLLLPSMLPSHQMVDSPASSVPATRLDQLHLDSIESDRPLFSPGVFDLEHWSWPEPSDAGRSPRADSDSFAAASRRRFGSERTSAPSRPSQGNDDTLSSPPIWSQRLSGRTIEIELPIRSAFTATGENDNARRPLPTRPDVRPAQTTFSGTADRPAVGSFRPLELGSTRTSERGRQGRAFARPLVLTDDEDSQLPARGTREHHTPLSAAGAREERRLQRARLASIERSLDPESLSAGSSESRFDTHLADRSRRLLSSRRLWTESNRGTAGLRPSGHAAEDGRSVDRPLDLDRDVDVAQRPRLSEGLAARRERNRALYRPPTSRRSEDETALDYLRRLMSEDSSVDESEEARLGMSTARRVPAYLLPSLRPSTSDTFVDRIALDPRNFVADDDWSGFDTFEGLMRLADEIGHAETRVPQKVLDTLPTCEYGKWDGGSCKIPDRCPTPPDKGKGKQKVELPQRDLMCPICREDYLDPDLLMSVPHCDHAFHAECLTTWFKNAKTCPLCRSDVFDRPAVSHPSFVL